MRFEKYPAEAAVFPLPAATGEKYPGPVSGYEDTPRYPQTYYTAGRNALQEWMKELDKK